ncbi:uncharacterized protein BDR25DRAFT_356225 [Lindgomyces ingoldianus]|uniref:Uncharacterized protein n=1 Tax=Lindgomyces ingoldianus TaxID=673940 RepID=A0ACB6QRH0_9PLEO|nr:uncharacterized protein BDR25DRAFT_356225 [Lindgomyces ingoldianus]KAF2469531.1 hypothetical protein BDR25DRAFT_356225 [Lindgomyces ingoldianus]
MSSMRAAGRDFMQGRHINQYLQRNQITDPRFDRIISKSDLGLGESANALPASKPTSIKRSHNTLRCRLTHSDTYFTKPQRAPVCARLKGSEINQSLRFRKWSECHNQNAVVASAYKVRKPTVPFIGTTISRAVEITSRAVIMAILGKTLHYLELHTALFSSAISTNYRLVANYTGSYTETLTARKASS